MSFREWPLRRILLLSVGWIFASLLLLAWLIFRMLSVPEVELSGTGAVSFGLYEAATVLFGPPLLLWLSWLVSRRAR